TEKQVREAVELYRRNYRLRKQNEHNAGIDNREPTPTITEAPIEGETWRHGLLEVLKSIPAEAFERLCQRVLRESNFIEVEVTGKSGDGGIDGIGILKLNLLSFRVVFQAKRYKDAVQASVVRDFRGGMVGRADKGLILTTGRFTPGAKKEAVRDGAPAIDLVDGESFCDLLKSLRLGVSTRMVESVEYDPEFFSKI
ncbi:MAG TPA: restriction endonuclease, partial [Paracoccaceae bacterium]|nr:restriction endonuclease [Paracoccaceae bacterium]